MQNLAGKPSFSGTFTPVIHSNVPTAAPVLYLRRKYEDQFNAFPNFMSSVALGDEKYDLHFVALFSERQDAIPIILLHGWPGP